MSQQQGDKRPPGDDFLWGLCFIICLVFLIAWLFGEKISSFVLEYHFWKLRILHFVFETDDMTGILNAIAEKPPGEMGLSGFLRLGAATGFYWQFLIVPLIGWMAWDGYKKNPFRLYKRRLDREGLVNSEKILWKEISPLLKMNLLVQDIEEGKQAMGKTPVRFCQQYKLLDENNRVVPEKAQKVFIAQLGKMWEGAEKLPMHARALFAIFAMHGCGDKVKAYEYMDRISVEIAEHGKPDLSWVNQEIKNYAHREEVEKVVAKHAYEMTVMASMLEFFARRKGVLPSSKFRWLKPRDRLLWFTLNCAGRQVPFVEVAGIFGHWLAEQVAGHAIERPYVKEAVDGLAAVLTTETRVE